MAKAIGRFDFELTGVEDGKNVSPGELSLEMPTVQLFVAQGQVSEDGIRYVTAEIRSETELDAVIKQIKVDLDAVGTRAKAILRREEARIAAKR
ncbi:MAG: hypothetical protein EOS70_13815 [Mesorhizobium sp.]|uniref:hypothetical protein n=1 Tax=Mesorhizobium sp. TaxID=1871066 RepID=UPI000FE7938C|nr:hypothetical protein [Mesorhizobium sp.]RWC34656.1 MAG: hypothetical protein EOS70_13815 [Mesorhizobium sp.]TIS74903.1 MAG: hypothetical protein E5W94_23240 [Mesorhizobium sp.]